MEQTSPANSEARLLPAPDAARQLGLGLSTIRAHIALGNIKIVRLGRRVLIAPAELARIAKRGLPQVNGVRK